MSLHDLPDAMLSALPSLNEPLADDTPVSISPDTNLTWLLRARDEMQGMIHDTQCHVLALYELVRSGKEGWETVQKRMGDEIETLFDRLIFTGDDNVHSQRLLLITSQVREEFYRLEKRFNMQLNGNCIYALSHYLIHRTALAPSRLNSEQIRQLDAFLAQKYPLLYSFCLQILETLGQKLDLEPRRIDMLLLALWLHKQGANNQKQVTHAVILAHGYATASSIANVANRLLKNTIFESFDMPLDVTPEAIAQQVMRYLEEHPLASGLMILVDMGSLKAIHRHFDRALSTPVTIINNVSTSMALYVGERILQGHFIEEIARDIARDVPVEYQLYWPKSNKPRAILTTCATGIGVATNLCALLSASIPQALEIDVVACDYAMLASNKTQEPVFMRYDVLAIVGTLASGVLNSVELILGKRSNVWTLCAYVEESVDLSQQVDTLIARIPPEDEIIALTDIFAGSVNNEFVRYLSRENFHLLAGINLPLVIDLFMSENDGNTTHTIMTALADSKENIQYCNQTITSAMQSDKDF